MNEARARARAAHDAFDDANARLSAARVDKGRLEVQVDAAVNAIVHDCKVPLDRALETPELEDRGATEDAAFKLRRRIANMGTINPDAAEAAIDTRCAHLASVHGLTEREGEVFALLARGRNGAFIQEECRVTRNTAKTHIRHIYQKLGVHTQQELIDLVESGRDFIV